MWWSLIEIKRGILSGKERIFTYHVNILSKSETWGTGIKFAIVNPTNKMNPIKCLNKKTSKLLILVVTSLMHNVSSLKIFVHISLFNCYKARLRFYPYKLCNL